jgi:hypothetical protein
MLLKWMDNSPGGTLLITPEANALSTVTLRSSPYCLTIGHIESREKRLLPH